MPFIRIIIVVCCCLLECLTYAQRDSIAIGQPLTMQRCIRLAYANHTELQIADLQMQSTNLREQQITDLRLPVVYGALANGVSLGRGIDPYTNNYLDQQIAFSTWNVYSEWSLYDGGEQKRLLDQAQINSQIAQLNRQKILDQLTLEVLHACLTFLQCEDQMTLASNQVAVTREEVNRLDVVYKSGASAPMTLLEMKAQLAKEELAVVYANSYLRQARHRLGQLTGQQDWEHLQLAREGLDKMPASYPLTPEAVSEIALRNFAAIKIADLSTDYAQKATAIALGSRKPRITLFARLGTNYSSAATRQLFGDLITKPTGDLINVNGLSYPVLSQRPEVITQKLSYFNQFFNNFNANVGVQLTVPLFDAHLAKNKAALAEIGTKEAAISSEAERKALLNAVEEAFLSLTAAKERYDAIQVQINALEEAFKITEVRFRETIIPGTEYLAAKNNLLAARTQLVTARYEYLFCYKILDFYQGRR
jgi:outer membrane protein